MPRTEKDEFLFLGTGASSGVPQIGCACPVCQSTEVKNKRSRCSGILKAKGRQLLIDATPDLRSQFLREDIAAIDGLFVTHVHADHVFGLDDLRPISLARDEPLPVFADAESCRRLRQIFDYVFATEARRDGIPWLALREIVPGEPFRFGEAELLPVSVVHGAWPCSGLRYGNFAYLTDLKRIPLESMRALKGIQMLVLDLLRDDLHPTHMCRDESLAAVGHLGNPKTWFIHMGHEVDHLPFQARLPFGTQLAYDGLKIEF